MNINQVIVQIGHLFPSHSCLGSGVNESFICKSAFSFDFEVPLFITFQCGSTSNLGAVALLNTLLFQSNISFRFKLQCLKFVYFLERGFGRHFSIPKQLFMMVQNIFSRRFRHKTNVLISSVIKQRGFIQKQEVNVYTNITDNIIMTHLAIKSLTVCILYGVMSIFQTLNSRYLYRNLSFDFYSFVFALQRIVIIAIFYWQVKDKIKAGMLVKILPYSLCMCLNNILSSYCLTVMPLAAFLSFKKFVVLFILVLTVIFNKTSSTNTFQNYCIIGIVVGGAMVGQRDILHGHLAGYVASLTYNLSESLSLLYAAYLYRHDGIQPSQLLIYNCIISLPYYLGVMTYEAQFDDIYYFFQDHFSAGLVIVLGFSVMFSCVSELMASYIAMVISPFEKSAVSNIKDLILMVISVVYLHDYTITIVSGAGIILCLISSALFSMVLLQQKDDTIPISQHSSIDLHHEGTSLLDDRNVSQQITPEHHDSPHVKLSPTPGSATPSNII